jgi:DNA repair protein SbcD/Mre11
MRIVHFSDTHLGFQTYRAIDPATGLNQREADVYDAFRQAVDLILELKPDAALHSGDLFNSVRPTNQALTVAFEQLTRLGAAGIPLVVISGNHSLPRVRGTASVFRLFDLPEFPLIHPVYKSAYEKIRLGDLMVHAVPQCQTDEDLHTQLELAAPDSSAPYNVLMLHAAVAGVPEFSMGEFSEQVVPEQYLRPDYDYIALGHYHRKSGVRPNAYYAGATERLTFGEVDQEKGILEVDLATKAIKFHQLKLRPMRDLPHVDATGLDAEALQAAIESTIGNADGSIARLTVENISPETQNALDFNRLKDLTKLATHLEIRYNRAEDAAVETINVAPIGSLSEELRDYLRERPAGKNTDKVLQLGLEYLDRAARERQ